MGPSQLVCAGYTSSQHVEAQHVTMNISAFRHQRDTNAWLDRRSQLQSKCTLMQPHARATGLGRSTRLMSSDSFLPVDEADTQTHMQTHDNTKN